MSQCCNENRLSKRRMLQQGGEKPEEGVLQREGDMLEESMLQREQNKLEKGCCNKKGRSWRVCCNERGICWRRQHCNERETITE